MHRFSCAIDFNSGDVELDKDYIHKSQPVDEQETIMGATLYK